MALSAFGQSFKEELKTLDKPDRNTIRFLQGLAAENVHEVEAIVAALEQHVLSCPANHKLPALYLVDCILKLVGEPYLTAFQINLAKMFSCAWRACHAERSSLGKLLYTWRGILPSALHASLAEVAAQQTSATPVSAPILATTASTAPASAPAPAALSEPVQQPFQALLPAGVSLTEVLPSYSLHPPDLRLGANVSGSGVALTSSLIPHTQTLHAAVYSHHVMEPSALLAAGSTFTLAGPQSAMMHQAAPLPAMPHDTLPGRPGQSSYTCGTVPSMPAASGAKVQLAHIKEYNAAAVHELLVASSSTRSKFLDLLFLRNRRHKSAAQLSRQWYVPLQDWLVGSTTAPIAAEPSIDEGGPASTSQEQVHIVEEDASQPECALSGEQFDRFYDPETDKWYYKDAVVLCGESAAKYGLMDGSIVKLASLAGAPLESLLGMKAQTTLPGAHIGGKELGDAQSTSTSRAVPGEKRHFDDEFGLDKSPVKRRGC